MKKRLLALSALAVALSLTAACGGDGSGGDGGTAAAPAAVNATVSGTATGTPSAETSVSATEPAPASPSASGSPFGTACADVPASVASEPVGKAISSIPSLSSLAEVIRTAGLVRTFNTGRNITVFAPTNEAFAKVPKKKLARLMGNKQVLSTVLAYHVVRGRKKPADLKRGKLTTVQGGELTTSGSGQDFKINDANVVCGDVTTRNAVVYLIDNVLLPK